MRRTKVKSSVIKAVGYDQATNVLEVEFHSGKVYRYFMVPLSAYRELIEAESIGAYFNTEIRNDYSCVEISD
jgi:hypothetical protein